MGFRDVIVHQYFDLDTEQVLLICQEALPGLLGAIRALEQASRVDLAWWTFTTGREPSRMVAANSALGCLALG
jgi:hypothetical protein